MCSGVKVLVHLVGCAVTARWLNQGGGGQHSTDTTWTLAYANVVTAPCRVRTGTEMSLRLAECAMRGLQQSTDFIPCALTVRRLKEVKETTKFAAAAVTAGSRRIHSMIAVSA